MRRHRLLIILTAAGALVTTCDVHEGLPAPEEVPTPARVLEASSAVLPPRLVLPVETTPDPYQNWGRWCESTVLVPCKANADCAPDRTGRATKCMAPWWSPKEKICTIPHPTKTETRRTKELVRKTVSVQCGKNCDADSLYTFLSIVAGRESSWRPWKQHRLNGDIKANRTSWSKYAKFYEGNLHRQRRRWQGWGLYGENSSLFTMMWDKHAPPEILCRPVVATETYLRVSRRACRKQKDLGIKTTWASIHAAASTGKVRPLDRHMEDFRKRAKASGFDADAKISCNDLGRGFGKTVAERNVLAVLLEADSLR